MPWPMPCGRSCSTCAARSAWTKWWPRSLRLMAPRPRTPRACSGPCLPMWRASRGSKWPCRRRNGTGWARCCARCTTPRCRPGWHPVLRNRVSTMTRRWSGWGRGCSAVMSVGPFPMPWRRITGGSGGSGRPAWPRSGSTAWRSVSALAGSAGHGGCAMATCTPATCCCAPMVGCT
ncbi:hypothetical protein D9M71_591350 [compost metagenome]